MAISDPLIFDRAAIRQLDRLAVEEFGIPSIVLMENAARSLAAATITRLGKRRDRAVLVCCGKGHNGGDGLGAARHLHNAGIPVSLLLAAEAWEYAGDAGVMAHIALRMGLHVQVAAPAGVRDAFDRAWRDVGRPAVILDALLGTGVEKMVQPGAVVAHLVDAVNAARQKHACTVIAADLPSGLDCNSGRPLVRRPDGSTTAVKADVTVTFVGMKRGFGERVAGPFVGEVVVADIGAPVELARRLGRASTAAATARAGGRTSGGGARAAASRRRRGR